MLELIFFSIIFVSDVQIDNFSAYPESVATLIAEQIGDDVVFDCGDLVENGGFVEIQEYETYQDLFPHSVPVPGNHDHYDGLVNWSWPTEVDTYVEGVHLVGFDTYEWTNPTSLELLSQALDDGDVFTILFMHHPVYSDNARNGHLAGRLRTVMLPIIEETGVDLVVAGHGHAFEHHQAIGRDFLVIGGGGAPLDVVGSSETKIHSASVHHWLEVTPVSEGAFCEVKDTGGEVIYSFTTISGGQTPIEGSTWGSLKALYR